MATNVFFDDTATGSGTGISTDDAYTSLDSLKSGRSAGDRCWVRRTMFETISGAFATTNDGNSDNPIQVIGCPRAAKSTTGNFTNDSETVSGIASADMSFYAHDGRTLIGPDGKEYWIDGITSTTEITLNKVYAGDTVSGGAFTIVADDYYDEFQAIDDSTWTTKISAWNSDSDAVGGWNNGTGINWTCNSSNWDFYNLRISTDSISAPSFSSFNQSCKNMYFIKVAGNNAINQSTAKGFKASNCIWTSPGLSNNYLNGSEELSFFRCSVRNSGSSYIAIFASVANIYLNDCNFESTTNGMSIIYKQTPIVKNCKSDGPLFRTYSALPVSTRFFIEDYNRVSGDHRIKYPTAGWAVSNDGSGADVNLRSGGADRVIDILFDINDVGRRIYPDASSINMAPLIFEHKIWQTSLSSKTYRYYVQSETDTLTASELWLEVEDVYGNITKSSNAIVARASIGDWTNYIEVVLTQPVEGWVTLRMFCAKYSATNHRYIDPQVEIT